MTDATDNTTIVNELLSEVKGYLPEMRGCLQALLQDSNQPEVAKELHRMTHTISGVAAMVQLDELSQAAGVMEKELDGLMDGEIPWSVQRIEVMSETVRGISNYCEKMDRGEAGDKNLYEQTAAAFAGLSESSAVSASENDSVDDLFSDFSDDETDDFFSQIEEGNKSAADDELQNLFDSFDDEKGSAVETESFFAEMEAAEDLADKSDDADADEQVAVERSIEPASIIDQELLECFNEEVEDHLENMGNQLTALSESVSAQVEKNAAHREILHSLRRSVHTMKGAAAVIGIQPVADWGHEFEDFLDWLHDESKYLSPEIVSAMFEGADLLEKISDDPEAHYADEIQRINTLFEGITGGIPGKDSSGVTTELDELLDVPDDNVTLDDANDFVPGIDAELLECFTEEVEEHFENIGNQLNHLSGEVTERVVLDEAHRESLHSLRRSVHTMKGAAAVIGIEPVAAWGHEFEDFLDWLHDESDSISPEIVLAMHDGADLLESIANDPDAEYGRELTETKDTFQEIIRKGTAEAEEPGDQLVVAFDPDQDLSGEDAQGAAIDSELLEIFNVEAEEHLENIGRKLNVLSTSVKGKIQITPEQRAGLHSLRRSVHDLKGAANVIGVKPVAEWGHEFENFLDWLHDESEFISPEIIATLLDSADILDKIADNPEVVVSGAIENVKKTYQAFIDGDSARESLEEGTLDKRVQVFKDSRKSGGDEQRKLLRKKTLRVGIDKIEEVMGLGGDMSINLSSSEESMETMRFTLEELSGVLQRLKGIASSLEAGYELATIPHFGSPSGGDEGAGGIIEEFDPLEMDRYSELNVLIRSLNETVVDLDSIRGQAAEVHNDWRTGIERQSKMLSELQNKMKGVQMTPFSTLANRLYRTVRESARVTGKSVRLVIEGGAIEMDTYVWDLMADPLMHMLRNSVDHGVETREERRAADKPEQATIRINCSRRGNQFALRLSDDGKGLDLEAIKKRALTLYPDLGVEQMDERELAGLIFRQGFSIRTQVTTMSGRGVGMDVVGHAVELLHGSVEVTTLPGKGAEFLFLLPITVAQLPALLVKFGPQQFAVPMRDITRVLRLTTRESAQETLAVDDDVLPMIRPARMLGLRTLGRFSPRSRHSNDNVFGLVVKAGGKRGVLVADAINGNREVVFKSLGSHLRQVPCVAGATIMGDGSLVPILHTEDLFNREKMARHTGKLSEQMGSSTDVQTLTVLAVDDSISIRKVLKNFITSQGWHPVLAVDGVDGMEKIRENTPDIVLLDVEMPRMNGFEVLQFLHSRPESRNVPVLMLTSRSADKYRTKADQLGARGFVTKPFDAEKLAALILKHTSKRSR